MPVFIEEALLATRNDLVTIAHDELVVDVAKRLSHGTDMLVVCDARGQISGIVTKTDVVRRIAQCEGAGCTFTAATVMTRDVVSCRPMDDLHDVGAGVEEPAGTR